MQNNETLDEYKKKFRQSKKKKVEPIIVEVESDSEEGVEPPTFIIKKKSKKPATPEPETVAEPAPTLVQPQSTPKTKKPRSEAQIAAFQRAQQIRFANAENRRKEREEIEKQHLEEVEEKLVKKAIAIKKRQIRETMIIDKIPDEIEIDDEVVKRAVAKARKPKVVFV